MRWIIFMGLIVFFLNRDASWLLASEAFHIWWSVLVPALLPFMVIVEWMLDRKIIDAIGVLFEPFMKRFLNLPGNAGCAAILSLGSGYPMAAKITGQLYMEHRLDLTTAQRVLNFATTADPIFISYAVSVGLFENPSFAPILLLVHYLSALVYGFLESKMHKRNKNFHTSDTKHFKDRLKLAYDFIKSGQNISFSIKKELKLFFRTANVLLYIGVTLCSFSVIIGAVKQLLMEWHPLFSQSFISLGLNGLLEVTLGLHEVSKQQWSDSILITLASMMLAWGGISVHAQCMSLLGKTPLSWKTFALSRIFHSGLAGVISWIICHFFIHSTSVFSSWEKKYFFENFRLYSLNSMKSLIFLYEISHWAIIYSFILVSLLVYCYVKSTDTSIRWDSDEKCDES